jgi:hypothetical protein
MRLQSPPAKSKFLVVGKVLLSLTIQESDDLGSTWITREEQAAIEIPFDPEKKFFRFSVKEDE